MPSTTQTTTDCERPPVSAVGQLTRHDWNEHEVSALFALPFNELVFKAASVHREHFDPNEVQVSTLLSIKTGACPEDCKYCPQSARYDTGLEKEQLLAVEQVVAQAKRAKVAGSQRFCMGAAWRNPKTKDMPYVTELVRQVKALGLETCMTLGMLSAEQAQELATAGLDYYNHNLDTSEAYYQEIITTRSYQQRLDTLEHVRASGMNVCSGGIVGMGESATDRVQFLCKLANLPQHPQSVPINMLVKVKGTPLAEVTDLEPFEFIRTIAVARIMMPTSYVRLSAGREDMNEQMQALCFLAGANSIFYGSKLLTTANPEADQDQALFNKLGINQAAMAADEMADDEALASHVNAQLRDHEFDQTYGKKIKNVT